MTTATPTDAETERTRERVRAECAAHLEQAAAYVGCTPEIIDQLTSFVDRAAALADEVIEFTTAAVRMDEEGAGLFAHARALGEPGTEPQVFEGVMQALAQHSDDGMAWRRLYMAGRRSRMDVAEALSQLVRQLRRP